MSKQLQNPVYYGKSLESQWRNNIFSSHDLMCGCKDPILHLLIIINREGNAPKPESDVKNIKCLITGEEDKDGGKDIIPDDFEPGELDRLFSEPGPEEDAADDLTDDG